ncbi:Ti-type conjugative transfer relaxase TraA (plasmid) [Nitrobacteraceae bacterium UC4446_H13]
MAITHFTPQLISRADGRSAVLAAAYRHCAKMTYEVEARVVDYTGKRNMVHDEFVLPPEAPQWARAMIATRSAAESSAAFWNKVESFEKRSDAQLSKEYIIALPIELTTAQNVALMRQFVAEHILSKGQVADWVYHDDPGNPHVHLMTSLRPLTEDGFGPKRVRVLGEDGATLRGRTGKIVYKLWTGDKNDFLSVRQGWIDLQNHHLALAGLDVRVDGRSYAERGIDIVPTTHIGVATKAIERRARRQGRGPDLDRLRLFEDQRQLSAERIMRRPEIVLDIVSREKSVFDERDVAKVLHRYVDDAGMFAMLLARILQSPDAIRLEREGIDFANGARRPARYTTRELIRIEADMAKRAVSLSESSSFGVSDKIRDAVLSGHAMISDEQRSAIEHVTAAGRSAAVVGRAGAGKTTMMHAAREVWEAAGYRVVGGTLAGKAAEGLEKEAGIASRTLASWELAWSKGGSILDSRTVFVLDEAGMVASRQMATFVEAVSRAGAKLVLVGDPEQLQPIEAGAAFRALVDRIGYAELETIYRQKAQWMRDASLDLARGRVGKALAAYRHYGRVMGSELKAQAVTALIDDWSRDYDPKKSTLILAHLRRDVRALNEMARASLVSRGLVDPGHSFRTEDGERRFAAGDQIVFLRNEGSLGVKNGMIGHVVEARQGWFTAEVGEGAHRRRVEVDQRFYRNVDHGYATTIHKAQGATVDHVKVLASLSLDKHLTYVALTRHREDVALYYGRRSFGKAGGLVPLLSQRNAKETTLDYERGGLYRDALRFAANRGLHVMRVARTLVSDRLDWARRQKRRFDELAVRLRAVGTRLGLFDRHHTAPLSRKKEIAPMLPGVTTWPKSIAESVEDKIVADPACRKQWQDMSARFALVFSDPEAAFKAMKFDAVLRDPAVRKATLNRLTNEPASFGDLRGGKGILAGQAAARERHEAETNVAALSRDIERYARLRNEATRKHDAEERVLRLRVTVDVPALSPAATLVLERVRDAIDRNDIPNALAFALSDKLVSAEIEGFNKAVSERFGEGAFLHNRAKEPKGAAFDAAAAGLRENEKPALAAAWPLMRAGQQLAAHQKQSAEVVKKMESQRQTQSRGMAMK